MICFKKIVGSVLSLSAFFVFMTGCSQKSETSEMTLPREQTLYLSGQQWGTPSTFNPLAESWMAAWPVGGRFNLMYEPLLTYNTLNGQIESLLGSLVTELSNNDSIVVDLNPKARWSDGKPVTAEDVKFIFELGFNYQGAVTSYATEQISGINVQTVELEDGVKVERLSFIVNKEKRNNPLGVYDILQGIRVVPSHIFKDLLAKNNNSLDEVKKLMIDKNPVVSGPYNLKDYSSAKIILERRDDYWGNEALHDGKLPAPKYIVHPIYKSNDHSVIAMRSGALDASMAYIPRIEHKYAAGVRTWYSEPPYFVPGAMPMMIINTTKAPLSDRAFRRALASAIDYTALRMFAVSNYSSDMKPGLIMPTNLEGRYINEEDLKTYGLDLYVPADQKADAVKSMLEKAGYKSVWNSDGTLSHMEKDGKRLPALFITCPAGWTDWEAIVTIAVEGMRKAGIDVREGFVDGGQYWPAMGTGNFDLIMHKPTADVSPSLPWSRFNEVISSRDWRPIGDWAGTNIGRYNQPGTPGFRPEVDSLLSAIPLMTDEEEKKAAYRILNRIFMEDQPAIPLVYLPEQFYVFSERVWTNWPSEKNPYGPPQLPWVASGTNTLWNLQLQK